MGGTVLQKEYGRRDSMPKKVVLSLVGKRITGYASCEYPTKEDIHIYPDEVAVDESNIELLDSSGYLYYEDGEILPMKKAHFECDKTSIQNDGIDTATIRLYTDEVTRVIVNQITGYDGDSYAVEREPIDGVIEIGIKTKMLGRITVNSVSDTCYMDAVEILITEVV